MKRQVYKALECFFALSCFQHSTATPIRVQAGSPMKRPHVWPYLLKQCLCGDWSGFKHQSEVFDPPPRLCTFWFTSTFLCPPQRSEDEDSSGWRGFLSSMGLSIPATLCRLAPPALRLNQRRMLQGKAPDIPEHVLRLAGVGPDKLRAEWTFPAFIAMFLPEFPHKAVPGHEHLQVLSYIAKGSFGPILKVKDKAKQKTYAVKVIPKAEILRLGVLEQSKEEVIIQRQVHHPFVHDLQDCWQTQRHIYIMCDYCSTGDLYTYWQMSGQFTEDTVRVFAAELGCALGFLHDFGIIHRDVKMENILLTDNGHLRLADFGLSRRLERGGRAFTICGTIQYMAPEVLSGGPYNHAADWWSLGILLFSLVTGKVSSSVLLS
uniref:Ribosomal protein S6 kinase related n=1 Tax=Tetraodon nigroviridis TaxID=99883 RepID=H3C9R9_TETNG